MAKSLMIQGTASGVGKTILTLALCRIFKQDGYSVAPFKAQNMTNNTCLTAAGEEITISQWLQALAAETEPTPDMNPIILKPSGMHGRAFPEGNDQPSQKSTQVILNGKHFDNINAYNFKEIKQKLVPDIMAAYTRLYNKYDLIVIEGAGSPVELNLNKDDIVNMGMAKRVKSPVVLVSDIDRGGVFASLYGTISLMDETEKKYVKATIVNRFKGEPSYFADGIKILADITNYPVAGVIPYTEINLPEEDSLFGNDGNIELSTNFEAQFNHIAENVRKSIDMDLIYKILEEGVE